MIPTPCTRGITGGATADPPAPGCRRGLSRYRGMPPRGSAYRAPVESVRVTRGGVNEPFARVLLPMDEQGAGAASCPVADRAQSDIDAFRCLRKSSRKHATGPKRLTAQCLMDQALARGPEKPT